jgi:electron transfer flavoprotein beta subunit
MKIVVCVKQVPATNEVRINPETNTIIREGIEAIINPFDTYAIEEALRLKERFGGSVTAISMGIPSVAVQLLEIMALGVDQAVLLSDRKFAGADSLATAYALAGGISHLGPFDLVICGKQATDGDTAQVGPSLAEKLGVPHTTYVRNIEAIDELTISCNRLTDNGHELVQLDLPAVITVVKEINIPRLPSIAGIRAALKSQVSVWSAADIEIDEQRIGISGSPTQVLRTFIPNQTVTGELLTGRPEDQARQLLERLLAKGLLPVSQDSEVQHG